MSAVPISAFDRLATNYDEVWTHSHAGRLQREAVWRHLDPLIHAGDRILDLGCGTGEDALHFSLKRADVVAIDSSPMMVEAAHGKGVDARVMSVEDIASLEGTFDKVISNFGALNCVRDLSVLGEPLQRLVRPGGHLAICLMSRFCLWESLYYSARGRFGKAVRRWRGEASASIGLRVLYPSSKQVQRALSPHFQLVADVGIGVCVPPSFVRGVSPALLTRLGRIDARIDATRIGRSIGDHRLLVFSRI